MKKKFRLSVSLQKYADKNGISWNTVNYSQRELTVDELVELVKQGYCFCHCFKSKDQVMRQSEKRDNNFISGQVVFIDIDNSEISLHDFLECLTKKPTIAYTTPNNYTEKSHWLYRFRLCYLLNEPITSISQYADVYDCITKSICQDLPNFRITDNCGRKASQQFSGNGLQNVETIISDNTYSISDFPFENNNVSSSSFYKSETEKSPTQNGSIKIVDHEFMQDFHNLNSGDILNKYRERYPYFDRTHLHFENGYAIVPDDYLEVHRSWYRDTIEKTNGDIINIKVIKKHRDGEGRRRKLFIVGKIMKKIMPSITYEHLLCNLTYERYHYYDNSDRVLTNNELERIAKNVMNTPDNLINLNRKKKKIIVDKKYCVQHGISPNTMKNKARKEILDNEIGNLYDISKSVKENLSYLMNQGIKVGKTRLYDWCKENGVSTKGLRTEEPAFLSSFTKHQLKVIIREEGIKHQYFIADNTHEKEISQSQYYDLLQVISLVA